MSAAGLVSGRGALTPDELRAFMTVLGTIPTLDVVAEIAPRARLAVVLGGDTSAWPREGGSA